MPDKYIIIKSTAVPRGMAGLASSEENMTVFKIDSANVAAVNGMLATIDSEEWTGSDSTTERNGDTTDSLVLPKKAVQ